MAKIHFTKNRKNRKFSENRKIQPHVPFKGTTAGDLDAADWILVVNDNPYNPITKYVSVSFLPEPNRPDRPNRPNRADNYCNLPKKNIAGLY